MPITRNHTVREVAADGTVISEQTFVIDVTSETVHDDIGTKARAALNVNATFLALSTPTNAQIAAQVKVLTRECSGLIRLLIGADLLVENTDT